MGTPSLYEVYQKLYDAFGPQNWWPGESPFEVLVGAILVQNTSWSNVEKAICRLREEGLMCPQKLYRLKDGELEELVKPVGYYRIKARRLKNVLHYLVVKHDGSMERMFALPIDQLRRELLNINGVGPETADSIILYAGNLPTFVVDAYTLRICARHGWVDSQIDYHTLKDFFESQLEPDVALYNEYHALLVRLGKDYCKKRPRCDECPLRCYLPDGGPYEPDFG